jgi:MFS family permease
MIKKHDPYNALRYPDYRNYVLARLLLTVGSLMQAIIVGWQVYEITKDPFSLGLIGLAEAVPSILISLYAGHVTDTSNRKYVLLFSYSLLLFCSASLLTISTDYFTFLITHKLIAIYFVIFVSGIARGFAMPSAFAFMAQLIPEEVFPNAVTWNTSTWQLGAISGPAIGGFVYGLFGVSVSYLTVTVLVLTAVILLSRIEKKPTPVVSEDLSLRERIAEGIKFVFANKIILSAISLDMFAVLFGGATAMLPVFASDILKAGPEGLGMLRAAPSIGAVFMALYMTRKPPLKRTGEKLFVCVLGFGICIIVFAVSKDFYLSLFALAMSGMFDSVSVVIRATIIQLRTPDRMKGRVSSVNSIFIGSSNEIGAFESGVAAKLMGVVPSVIFGGVMTIVVVMAVFYLSPELRRLTLAPNAPVRENISAMETEFPE